MYSSFRQGVNIAYFLSAADAGRWMLEAGIREERRVFQRGVDVERNLRRMNDWRVKNFVGELRISAQYTSNARSKSFQNFGKLIYR